MTRHGRFKAAVKKIILNTAETKRRAVSSGVSTGNAMVITATTVENSETFNGLWLGSISGAANTLSRPDTALSVVQNCVFGAIAKGDDSFEREGDNVDLTYMSTRYLVNLRWNQATTASVRHQRIQCLEFLICVKNPSLAIALCIDMDTGGNDYSDTVMQILMAGGCFANQGSLVDIQTATPLENTCSNQALWNMSIIRGIKEWTRDLDADEQDERRNGKSIGSVVWKKWRTFKRPLAPSLCQDVPAHASGIPIVSATGAVAVLELGADGGDSNIGEHNICNQFQSQLVPMGFTKRMIKKPIKLKWNLNTDGSETTASLPLNKCFVYGTWWNHDSAAGAVVTTIRGKTEMRWKDP